MKVILLYVSGLFIGTLLAVMMAKMMMGCFECYMRYRTKKAVAARYTRIIIISTNELNRVPMYDSSSNNFAL